MSPAESVAAGEPYFDLRHVRQLVETAVPKYIAAWAKIAGLAPDAPWIQQFRQDLTEALHACLRECLAARMRVHHRLKDMGEDFGVAAQHPAGAAEQLHLLLDVLDRLPMMWWDDGPDSVDGLYDVTRRVRCPLTTARELESLAAVAGRKSDRFKAADRGGPTPTMRAFKTLARGLVLAAQRANIKAKQRLELTKAVLKVARRLTKDVTGAPLQAPAGDQALGKYLSRLAQARDKYLRRVATREMDTTPTQSAQ
jgi:hypothetical protein